MTQALRIKDGVAVITGAASGIGMGLAQQAAALGMRLVLADVQADALQALAERLDTEVLVVPTDVTDANAVEQLARRCYAAYGEVDLLFNNAGVMVTGFSWQIETAAWQRCLGVNFYGVLHGLRSFVPRLLSAARPAHIINTSSVGGFLASPLMAPYSVSKYAVLALTESLRGEMEMLKAPVRVSLLAPGPVKTGIFRDPFGGVPPNPVVGGFVRTMREMLTQNGLEPEAFAQRVFDGIRAGQFWLIPQPEVFDQPYRAHADSVLARRNPCLPQY
ncbi:MAG: SDR family NAD(P)-dependent oxidoreductase [Stenotrophobium sp.]